MIANMSIGKYLKDRDNHVNLRAFCEANTGGFEMKFKLKADYWVDATLVLTDYQHPPKHIKMQVSEIPGGYAAYVYINNADINYELLREATISYESIKEIELLEIVGNKK